VKRIFIFALVIFSLDIGFLYLFRGFILNCFTQSEDIQDLGLKIYNLALITHGMDFWNGMIQGVIKALGKQAQILVVNFFFYDLIILPLSYYLIFRVEREDSFFELVTSED